MATMKKIFVIIALAFTACDQDHKLVLVRRCFGNPEYRDWIVECSKYGENSIAYCEEYAVDIFDCPFVEECHMYGDVVPLENCTSMDR